MLSHLSIIAKGENASFIRVSPLLEENQENQNIFADLGFRPAPMHSSAYEATWKLALEPEEVLLQQMRKTTRYLIKKASENPDISVQISSNPNDIEVI